MLPEIRAVTTVWPLAKHLSALGTRDEREHQFV
jgi:hypothetical protein